MAGLRLVALVMVLAACGGGGAAPQATDRGMGGISESEVRATEAAAAATAPPVAPTPVAQVEPEPIKPRVEKRFDLPSPDWLGAGAGSIWVKRDDGVLTRIDPATNKVVKDITVQKPGAQLCQGLGVSEDSIWTCGGDADIVRIDPETNREVARLPLGKTTDQSFIPIVAEHAWFLIGDGSELHGVSLSTNDVDVEIALGTRCVDLGADEQSIWAACLADSLVLHIDPAAASVTDRIAGLAKPRSVSVGEAVWVTFDGGIGRIDPTTAEVTGAVAVSVVDGGIFAGEQSVWVRRDATFLQRIDADSMELVEVLTAPETGGGSVTEAFGSVWATAYNDTVLYRLRP